MHFLRKIFSHIKTHRWAKAVGVLLGVFAAWWLVMLIAIPRPLFDDPYSTLIYSRDGDLLGARIAADEQWRFPPADSLPAKYIQCLVAFEDKRFFWHPGIDPAAVVRALGDNIKAKEVVSGGSTITMQLARLARGDRDRVIHEKFIEAMWAVFFETRYSKERILCLYASHAPFGGNVVGVETAAWRYFGRSIWDLSWAETATLAVLPNSPALIHPGRNRDALREKRDRLLASLAGRGVIDDLEYELACMEPLPDAPVPLPNEASHLLERVAAGNSGSSTVTSIDKQLQVRVQDIVDRYAKQYASNHIYNLAAIVADIETGEVLAYCGNVSFPGEERHGNAVDVIASPRSTGSILKPLLYAGMLNDGMILPGTLISDTPLNISGFRPQNYDRAFRGAVTAREAIERSLNVPLVRMLSQYNTGRFMSLLKSLGMTTLRFDEGHYGASLILGGAEGTLWDLAGIYASLARTLNHYQPYNGRYDPSDIHPLTTYPAAKSEPITSIADKRLSDSPLLSHSAVWYAFEAMASLNRPEEEADWQQFSSMKKIAWKTGTSYGGRDAWAIGVTPRYVVGVWAGNASGEGRAGLTGVGNSAPVLFDIFSLLPGSGWFAMPYDDTEPIAVCRHSGHKATELCEQVDTLYVPRAGVSTEICPYHRLIHLSTDSRWQVNTSCESSANIVSTSWFVLPPAQEYYYRNYHLDYRPLPPVKPGCRDSASNLIDIIYPEHGAALLLPRGIAGEPEKFVFRAAHASRDALVYWYIDENYLGRTEREHTMSCEADPGTHILLLTDGDGNRRAISFSVK